MWAKQYRTNVSCVLLWGDCSSVWPESYWVPTRRTGQWFATTVTVSLVGLVLWHASKSWGKSPRGLCRIALNGLRIHVDPAWTHSRLFHHSYVWKQRKESIVYETYVEPFPKEILQRSKVKSRENLAQTENKQPDGKTRGSRCECQDTRAPLLSNWDWDFGPLGTTIRVTVKSRPSKEYGSPVCWLFFQWGQNAWCPLKKQNSTSEGEPTPGST